MKSKNYVQCIRYDNKLSHFHDNKSEGNNLPPVKGLKKNLYLCEIVYMCFEASRET